MPYPSIEDLPPSIRTTLPPAAQRIYREAFNEEYARSQNDKQAAIAGWVAVKHAYHKVGEDWLPLDHTHKDPPPGSRAVEYRNSLSEERKKDPLSLKPSLEKADEALETYYSTMKALVLALLSDREFSHIGTATSGRYPRGSGAHPRGGKGAGKSTSKAYREEQAKKVNAEPEGHPPVGHHIEKYDKTCVPLKTGVAEYDNLSPEEKMAAFEAYWAEQDDGFEHQISLDKDGNVICQIYGDEHSCDPYDMERDAEKGGSSTHFHPGKDVPFSNGDIKYAGEMKLDHIKCFSTKTEYTMRPSKAGAKWPTAYQIDSVFWDKASDVVHEYEVKNNRGSLPETWWKDPSVDEAIRGEIWARAAPELGLTYTSKPLDKFDTSRLNSKWTVGAEYRQDYEDSWNKQADVTYKPQDVRIAQRLKMGHKGPVSRVIIDDEELLTHTIAEIVLGKISKSEPSKEKTSNGKGEIGVQNTQEYLEFEHEAVIDLASFARELIALFTGHPITLDREHDVRALTKEAYQKGNAYATFQISTTPGVGNPPGPWQMGPMDPKIIDLLVARDLAYLSGIDDEISKKIMTGLADGMLNGEGYYKLAERVAEAFDTTWSRAKTIARTEMSDAANSAALQRFAEMDIEEVEWLSALEPGRTCKECEDNHGHVYTLDEAEDLIPAHPNCLCTWIPVTKLRERQGSIGIRHTMLHKLSSLITGVKSRVFVGSKPEAPKEGDVWIEE